jgi:hypothetical protein
MKIKETIERECCEDRDMKRYRGLFSTMPQLKDAVFCIHCGNIFTKESYTDAAGGRDWKYECLPLDNLYEDSESQVNVLPFPS